jgi:hypothetical protein
VWRKHPQWLALVEGSRLAVQLIASLVVRRGGRLLSRFLRQGTTTMAIARDLTPALIATSCSKALRRRPWPSWSALSSLLLTREQFIQVPLLADDAISSHPHANGALQPLAIMTTFELQEKGRRLERAGGLSSSCADDQREPPADPAVPPPAPPAGAAAPEPVVPEPVVPEPVVAVPPGAFGLFEAESRPELP